MTLQCCINNCKASEASNTQIKSLGQSIKEEVRRVKETSKRVKKEKKSGREGIKTERLEITKKVPASRTCKFCGGNHRFGRQHCPAREANCRSGGKDNHLAKCCQSTNRNRTHGVREEYEESSSDEDDINEERLSESDYINCMTLTPDSISTVEHRENAQEIYTEMIPKGKAIRFHVE